MNRRRNRKADEKFIQMHMDACRNFTGFQNIVCESGVFYEGVRRDKTASCFKGNFSYFQPNEICRHRSFPSRKEAEEYLRDSKKRTRALMAGKCPDCGTALIEDTITEGRFKGHGEHICPKCRKVKMWI